MAKSTKRQEPFTITPRTTVRELEESKIDFASEVPNLPRAGNKDGEMRRKAGHTQRIEERGDHPPKSQYVYYDPSKVERRRSFHTSVRGKMHTA
ncbi:hypothetical protein COLO4_07639 [Corchorus olitorius]|uniref:Uncharacterized protein n=1 Tax=Corchorus olitorius TaxID=93759 RepID=A0A1R3KJ50_9ROSI|nr:hypothetical protein COLO4_07639 [Corchorus olitorius]